jgi:hypothetical protein
MTCYLPWIYAIELLLALALIIALSLGPNGYWKVGEKRQKDPKILELAETRRKAEIELLKGQSAFDAGTQEKETAGYLTKKVFAALDYAIKRHDWFEDQRSRIFQVSLTILSIVLGVLAIGAKASDSLTAPYPFILLVFAGGTTILLIRMLWLYSSELNADRPYRLVSDVAFWYFRYNLPGESHGRSFHADAQAAASAVLKEREIFFRRIVANFPIIESMREDIEQLFILHVLQRYKSESLKQLQWVLNCFLIFSALQVVFLLALHFVFS